VQGAVLAVLELPAEAPALLRAAAQAAQVLGAALHALAVRIPADATILPSEEVLTSAHRAAWDAAEQHRIEALAQCAHEAGAILHMPSGDPLACLTAQAAAAGLLVLPRPHPGASAAAHALLHYALFASRRPVLLVPPGFAGTLTGRVAIAWKPDERADKAVLAVLPLLRQAEHLYLLATDPAASPAVLRDADLHAEPCLLPENPSEGLGAAILSAAAQAGCHLLVMGAYGHSRLREMVLGGVTRHVLAEAELPVLMCH
jgi:nucleotide-binding universal stress UspA family protein